MFILFFPVIDILKSRIFYWYRPWYTVIFRKVLKNISCLYEHSGEDNLSQYAFLNCKITTTLYKLLLIACTPSHLCFLKGRWTRRVEFVRSDELDYEFVVLLTFLCERNAELYEPGDYHLELSKRNPKSGKQEWSPDSTSYRQFLHTGRRTTPAVHSSLPALFSRTIRTMRTTAWGSYDKRSLAAQLKFSLMLRHNTLLITHRVKDY